MNFQKHLLPQDIIILLTSYRVLFIAFSIWFKHNSKMTLVKNYCVRLIAVCIYRLVMMSIDLSKKFTPHMQTVTGSTDVIVTQLLRYHMPLLYCMQPFNFLVSWITLPAAVWFRKSNKKKDNSWEVNAILLNDYLAGCLQKTKIKSIRMAMIV